MPIPNPYLALVKTYQKALQNGQALPLGNLSALAKTSPGSDADPDADIVLIFSPHPDDECIIGGLPLRLMRELGMRVINIAVTQGSHKPRQAKRWQELQAACDYIGFALQATVPGGLEHINLKQRADNPWQWSDSVAVIADILRQYQPKVIFFPHDQDWNSTHIGTHSLVVDALSSLDRSFSCYTVETEFWGAMTVPNLMVESSAQDIADLIAALSFHVGEVERNPYHIRLPAWLIDNVRRGSELVLGQGAAAPEVQFATLYRLTRWQQHNFSQVMDSGVVLGNSADLTSLFT